MKIVQIVATGMGYREHDVSTETWCLLKAFLKGVRADRIFSMDGLNLDMVRKNEITKDEIQKKIGDTPFITNDNFPLEKFPYQYFSNSVCYMLALAIEEGYERIELYGVNQAGLFEYMEQRKAVEFWLGVAIGRGIEIYIHPPTQLLKNKFDLPYGYETREGQKTERKVHGAMKKIIDLIGYMQGHRK